MVTENTAGQQRGRPFRKGMSGNPRGKPKGARHKATMAAEALLDGEAQALSRRAVELALAGDTVALRLCLERILPPRRDRPVKFDLPLLQSPEDAVAAATAITEAVASGELTPDEAVGIGRLIETYVKAAELHELERRVAALEGTERE